MANSRIHDITKEKPIKLFKEEKPLLVPFYKSVKKVKTKFITASDLMIKLQSAQATNKIDNYFKRVIGIVKLLIIDEFAYVKFNEIEANLFFQVINKIHI